MAKDERSCTCNLTGIARCPIHGLIGARAQAVHALNSEPTAAAIALLSHQVSLLSGELEEWARLQAALWIVKEGVSERFGITLEQRDSAAAYVRSIAAAIG